jgi:hypothetical protein
MLSERVKIKTYKNSTFINDFVGERSEFEGV